MSKRVTAPAKTVSSISPGDTAIARKRVATMAPRTSATSGSGGSAGLGWERADFTGGDILGVPATAGRAFGSPVGSAAPGALE